MKKANYYLVDVFTSKKYGGNQLAVFPDARFIPEDSMQHIAKELNLSETTFVVPPIDKKNDFRVRIFTPAQELPMAGHPTVGTAFIMARKIDYPMDAQEITMNLEEKVGLIPVDLQMINGDTSLLQKIQLMMPHEVKPSPNS